MPAARPWSVKSPSLHWSPSVAFGEDRSPRPYYETAIRAASAALIDGSSLDSRVTKPQHKELRCVTITTCGRLCHALPSRFLSTGRLHAS